MWLYECHDNNNLASLTIPKLAKQHTKHFYEMLEFGNVCLKTNIYLCTVIWIRCRSVFSFPTTCLGVYTNLVYSYLQTLLTAHCKTVNCLFFARVMGFSKNTCSNVRHASLLRWNNIFNKVVASYACVEHVGRQCSYITT